MTTKWRRRIPAILILMFMTAMSMCIPMLMATTMIRRIMITTTNNDGNWPPWLERLEWWVCYSCAVWASWHWPFGSIVKINDKDRHKQQEDEENKDEIRMERSTNSNPYPLFRPCRWYSMHRLLFLRFDDIPPVPLWIQFSWPLRPPPLLLLLLLFLNLFSLRIAPRRTLRLVRFLGQVQPQALSQHCQ